MLFIPPIEPDICPKCGGDVEVTSSREMRLTNITCNDCGFEKQYKCCEESAISRWNKLKRKSLEEYEKDYDE